MLKYFNSFQKYAFRLELLQSYDVEEEKDDYKKFLETGRVSESFNADWHDIIKRAKQRGAIMQRVHVVELPLSNYLKFEIEAYKYNSNAGEEIYMTTKEDYERIESGYNFDFWLFDDSAVLKIKYTQTGAFEGFEEIKDNMDGYITLKDKLLQNAKPLSGFLNHNHEKIK